MPIRPSSRNSCRIKVCGIRDPGEAAALDALGVDWIGFNFHPASARYITPEAAAPIIRSLKRSVAVGVFVDADAARVKAVADRTGIRMAQLHGAENWDAIQGMPLPVIKALPHTRLADLGGLRDRIRRTALPGAAAVATQVPDSVEDAMAAAAANGPLEYLLIDTQVRPKPGDTGFGGTGQVFDWSLLARHPLPLPYFLAGGLGPHNLETALAACSPFAVDLNSKVEIAPGRKDFSKIEACLAILGRPRN